MSNSVRITISGPYATPYNEFPCATLWVDDEIVAQKDLCVLRTRISFLPLWFPFNCRIDGSMEAQMAVLDVLEKVAQLVYGSVECCWNTALTDAIKETLDGTP